MLDPSGLSPGDALRDLFSLPMRKATAFERTDCGLSPWEIPRDPHLWEVVLIASAFAITPVVAATFAPLLMMPLALVPTVSEAAVGLGVLATAAWITVGGTALANAAGGENWYQGLGWQLIGTAGLLSEWASGARAQQSSSGKLVRAANSARTELVAKLEAEGLPKDEWPIYLAVVRDGDSGLMFYGIEGSTRPLHSEVLARTGQVPPGLVDWSPNNCAEALAASEALFSGARWDALEGYTVKVKAGVDKDTGWRFLTGKPKLRCDACRAYTTLGIPFVSDLMDLWSKR